MRSDRPSIRDYIDATGLIYGYTYANLVGPRRDQRLAEARHLAYWLAKYRTGASYPQVARAFGRDHTTVMHGCRVVLTRCLRDPLIVARGRAIDKLAWRAVELRLAQIMRRDEAGPREPRSQEERWATRD